MNFIDEKEIDTLQECETCHEIIVIGHSEIYMRIIESTGEPEATKIAHFSSVTNRLVGITRRKNGKKTDINCERCLALECPPCPS